MVPAMLLAIKAEAGVSSIPNQENVDKFSACVSALLVQVQIAMDSANERRGIRQVRKHPNVNNSLNLESNDVFSESRGSNHVSYTGNGF